MFRNLLRKTQNLTMGCPPRHCLTRRLSRLLETHGWEARKTALVFVMKWKTKLADFASDLGEDSLVLVHNPIWTDLNCGSNTNLCVA